MARSAFSSGCLTLGRRLSPTKAGATPAGARAASNHTGSLAGSPPAYEAAFRQAGILHAPIGKKSFGAEKLCQNLTALLDAVNRLKPSTAKGTYLKSMAVATTMGPGVKVDTLTIRKFLEG